MEVEIDRLDMRYEALRVRAPERERRILASLSEIGQIVPVVVVSADEASERLVLVDGYRRVRALRRLHQDVVLGVQWELPEIDALLLRRSLSIGNGETSLEQAWLLDELRQRFNLSLSDLARRFDRSSSWVSRRLALVRELPGTVQDLIREGRIIAHAAAKHLVPLARANSEHCERLANNIAPLHLSSRQIGELYAAWRHSDRDIRLRIVDDPQLFLRAKSVVSKKTPTPRTGVLEDLVEISAISRLAHRRVGDGAISRLSPEEQGEVGCALSAARRGFEQLSDAVLEAIGGNHA
jgi:ParB/RepB/Spo0J family partition protein